MAIFSLDEKKHSNLKIKICQNNSVLHIENRKTNGGSSKLWKIYETKYNFVQIYQFQRVQGPNGAW